MRWRVQIELTRRFEVEVEAENSSEAYTVAREQNEAEGHAIDCDVLEQLGEPWLRSAYWYDLHGPADIVVAEPSFGHKFSFPDIALLKSRLEALGLEVFDSWNGGGCTTVSFRCRGRIGADDFTDEQRAAICAPRPTST